MNRYNFSSDTSLEGSGVGSGRKLCENGAYAIFDIGQSDEGFLMRNYELRWNGVPWHLSDEADLLSDNREMGLYVRELRSRNGRTSYERLRRIMDSLLESASKIDDLRSQLKERMIHTVEGVKSPGKFLDAIGKIPVQSLRAVLGRMEAKSEGNLLLLSPELRGVRTAILLQLDGAVEVSDGSFNGKGKSMAAPVRNLGLSTSCSNVVNPPGVGKGNPFIPESAERAARRAAQKKRDAFEQSNPNPSRRKNTKKRKSRNRRERERDFLEGITRGGRMVGATPYNPFK